MLCKDDGQALVGGEIEGEFGLMVRWAGGAGHLGGRGDDRGVGEDFRLVGGGEVEEGLVGVEIARG